MKNFKKLSVLLLAMLVSVSCIVDDENDNGFQSSIYTVGFSKNTAVETYFEDEGVVLSKYPLDVLGGNSGINTSSDIIVNYVIDPASSATEGVEFDFVDNSGQLTIPAGLSFTEFPLNVNTGNFQPDAPTKLILQITSTNTANSNVSTVNDILEITFVGCLSNLAGDYNVTTLRLSDNTTFNIGQSTVTETSVNNYVMPTTGQFNLPTTFNVICGEIIIESQNLGGQFSNQVEGSGSVDPITGDLIINYTITPLFSDPFVAYKSTYIRL